MRIAYVIHSLDPGGTERLAVDIGLTMARDVPVAVFCLDAPGRWAAELRARGVAVHTLWRQPGLDLSVPVRLARGLREFGATIVHAHQCPAWFYAGLARWIHRRPRLVLHEHGRFFPEPDKPLRRLVNRLCVNPVTARFVAVSRDVGARLTRFEGVPGRRIEIVYNGTTPRDPVVPGDREAARARLGVPNDVFLIGTLGRLDPIKNLPLLFDAMAGLGAVGQKPWAVLIGDGPERPALEARARAAGLAERVRFAGHRDDGRALLPALDVFALPSLSEGTSMALLEAMAAGVPAVVTAVGGNPEVVVDGETGWVVPSGDVEALAKALAQAIGSPEERASRAAAGRARFESRFSADAMLAAWRRIYRELEGAA